MEETDAVQDGQRAIDLVLAALTAAGLRPPEWEWTVHPFRDAVLVCPVTRARGAGIYLVRRGEVRPVHSNRSRTEQEVYDDLVTEQGS